MPLANEKVNRDALKVLQRLSTDQSFERAAVAVNALESWLAEITNPTSTEQKLVSAELLGKQQLAYFLAAAVSKLLKAVSHGRLSPCATEQLRGLGMHLSLCMGLSRTTWPAVDESSSDKAARIKVATEIARSGLIPSLAAASESAAAKLQQVLSSFLQLPPQQQLDTSNSTAIELSMQLNLCKWLACLWHSTAAAWPQRTVFSGTLAPLTPPVVQLALGTLKAGSATAAACRNSCSSSSSSSAAVHPLVEAADEAATHAYIAANCFMQSILVETQDLAFTDAAATVIGSDSVIQLCLMFLACAAEQQHQHHTKRQIVAAAGAAAAGGASGASISNTSSSSSSGGSSAAPVPTAHYRQLFAALGLAPEDAGRSSSELLQDTLDGSSYLPLVSCLSAAGEAIKVKQELRSRKPLLQQASSSRGGSSSKALQQQQQQQDGPLIPVEQQEPLLHVLVQCCLMDPELCVVASSCQLMWFLLCGDAAAEAMLEAATAFARARSTTADATKALKAVKKAVKAAVADGMDTVVCTAPLGDAAAVVRLLELLLLQLSPVVLEAYKHGKLDAGSSSDSGSGSGSRSSSEKKTVAWFRSLALRGFGGSLISLVCAADASCLSAIISRDPLRCTALEAALRNSLNIAAAHNKQLSPHSESTIQTYGSKLLAALQQSAVAAAAAAALGAVAAAASSSTAAAAASAATAPGLVLFGPDSQHEQLSLRLQSLLVTCLKGLLMSCGGTAAGDARLLQSAVDICLLAHKLCSSSTAGSSGSSRFKPSVQQLLPWLALMARSTMIAAELRLDLDNNPDGVADLMAGHRSSSSGAGSSSELDEAAQAVARNPDLLLQRAAPAMAWLVEQLRQHQDLGLPASELIQIQQQLQYMKVVLPYATDGMCMSVQMPNPREARRGAEPQMTQVMGPQVANAVHHLVRNVLVQLPHPHHCNNPGCGTVTGLGELECMSGKGTVCSSCRVARLCSKECMQQHWARHKAVCKRIKAAAEAGSSS